MVTRLNTFLAEVCSQHGPEQMKNSEHNNNKNKEEKMFRNSIMLLNVIIYIRSPRCVSCTRWSHSSTIINQLSFKKIVLLSKNYSLSRRHRAAPPRPGTERRGRGGEPRGSKTPSQTHTTICSTKYGCQDHGRLSNTSRAGQVKEGGG